MPRGRRANIGRRTRHASQQQVYSQNLSEERQNIIRENARLRQRVSTRRSLASYNRLAFQNDPTANYSDVENLNIGPMTTVCRYCNALKFKRETAGLCCASGKVKLDPLLTPPQPLKPLFDGSDPDSSHFLQHILEYNNCFRMTSFGANIIREGGFMPTCKIQGQIYHLHGSMVPTPDEPHQFLQIYFISSMVDQLNVRCNIQGTQQLKRRIIEQLQAFFHANNAVVNMFKTALERMPSDTHKFVIRADCTPTGEHVRRFNAPTVNDVAAIIVGDPTKSRDIVVQRRSNIMHRVNETHRLYDALQYPIIYWQGQDGYDITLKMVDPITSVSTNKNLSAMNYYAYRMMIRTHEENVILKCRRLFQQFAVDMYVKVETERLAFIRFNQAKLRSEDYIHLRDAIHSDGDVQSIGRLTILPSSYIGSPRHMHEYAQDAMTYVRNYGTPDLFITFTCNPKWTEIERELEPGQKPQDRHDIIARVFQQKLKEQLRRIKRNQERERLAGNVSVPGSSISDSMNMSTMSDLGSKSPGLIPLGQIKQEPDLHTPSRRRAKLKPDLKLKCGACGQVGHMRTNKACPLYTGGGAVTPEHDEPAPEPDDLDLGYVDGTKLTLPSKFVKQSSEELRRRSGSRREVRAAGRTKRRGTASDSCDYLVKRPAERRRTDPLVTLSSLLEDVLNTMRHLPDVQPFLFPVNPKLVADYYRIVSRPMDLQTIRDNLRQKHYQSREEFLADVNQIVENSTLYNGPTSSLTVAAQRMMQRCFEKLAEKEEQFMKLEKQINPLLDDNDQVALSFIFENLLTTKLKVMPEAWPFLKPVNKKQVKDYYNVIKKPIDMETIGKKIQAHKYHSREEFLRDIQLLVDNCRAYNGLNSQFTRQAEAVLKVTQEALEQFDEHVSQLEANIARVQQKMLEDAEQSELEDDPPPPSDEKRGRGRPKKHKPSTSTSMADDATQRKRSRVKKDQNSLVDDLQYSDSGSSGLEEVEQKDAAEAMVQLSVRPDDDIPDSSFDTSEFLIKREVPDEPHELVDLDSHSTDYTYPAVVKEEPIEPDMNMDPPMMDALPEHTQFKEEPLENWQPDPVIQDDLRVTDSEEEAEDGLWF
ncbi:uncharacterized protein LOC133318861 [Danaus plexippus]|uniref:uncharacterized protein LOC133318861 n=1 Tax=Danaus plexippus TaxID=13037 RepID=UPI002AB07F86|nr:uncharacterized protein LOC133318861 [Danaus plexippus]